MSVQTTLPARRTTGTNRLLACGVAAAVLFFALWAIQAFTRAGFDPTYHPLSLLSLGERGWVQIANFVLSGLLYVACAVGMRKRLHPGRGAMWAPLLIGVNGLGLIVSGVFLTDAGAGFPPGTPDEAPEYSWHGILHEVGFALTAVSWLVLCIVFARRFAAAHQRGWTAACVLALVAFIVIGAWPDVDSLSVRLVLGSAVSFGFVAAVAVQLMRQPAASARLGDGDREPW